MNKVKSGLNRMSNFITLEDKQAGRKKVYASLWAIFFGLLIGSIVYMILGRTGKAPQNTGIFTFVTYMFQGAFQKFLFKDFVLLFLVFGFSGLAVAISFKSGLFNIGVPSQMLTPAIIFFSILIATRSSFRDVSTTYLFGMFFVSIIAGMFVGALSGFLKAFFNVHEVISTIFINWIIVYLSVWLFTGQNDVFINRAGVEGALSKTYFSDIAGTTSILIKHNVLNLFLIFGAVVFVVLSLGLWFMYQKTTLGYKWKMIGLNKSTAKYVGINEKLSIVAVMAFSGALAGIAGFFYYVMYKNKIEATHSPANISFECIAISLIALNSPIGISLSSFLYAIIYNSKQSFALKRGSEAINPEFFSLITGLIIFMAALAVMFYKFKPLRTMIKHAYLWCNKEYWLNFKLYHKSKNKYVAKERKGVWKAYRTELKLKSKFKKQQREFENKIAQMIAQSKEYNDQQLLDLYDKIARVRIEFNQRKFEFGFGKYEELKNKYKVHISANKEQYRALKEHLFTDAVKRNIKNTFVQWVNNRVEVES